MTKFGMKKDPSKPPARMKRTPLKRVSKKQAAENAELGKLVNELRQKAGGRSELTGKFYLHLDPHHFGGRGKNLCNPFTIVMCSRPEHNEEQKHMSYKHKQELRDLVRQIRIRQGYREEDYG